MSSQNLASIESFLEYSGDEVQDVDEETFDIFSYSKSNQDLGMVDAEAEELEISISGRDFTIKQSPGILQSKRAGGTTGAAVWRTCVHFSEWIGSSSNTLLAKGIIDSDSVVIELGSGISGLVPSMLSTRVGRVIATDQAYALRLLQENITTNRSNTRPKKAFNKTSKQPSIDNIEILSLDWEQDDINGFLRSNSLSTGLDAVIVCDCIFNYALIQPLVQTCVDICSVRRLRETTTGQATKPTLCIIAQQLRQPEIFEHWLRAFMNSFRVWRLGDSMLTTSLSGTSGFVVHVGVLRKPES